MIKPAHKEDLKTVREITQITIKAICPRYYPA